MTDITLIQLFFAFKDDIIVTANCGRVRKRDAVKLHLWAALLKQGANWKQFVQISDVLHLLAVLPQRSG